MKLRALLLSTLPVLFAPSARADEPRPKLADVRTRTDEMQHQVQLAHDRLAAMSKALMTASHVSGLAETTIDVTLTSTHTWNATTEKPLHVTATVYELNDISVPFERRPQLRWSDGAREK